MSNIHPQEYNFKIPRIKIYLYRIMYLIYILIRGKLKGESNAKAKLLISEKELIELTMEYGYSGSELNNPHFLEKGFLKKNGAYDSFIKKLNQSVNHGIV